MKATGDPFAELEEDDDWRTASSTYHAVLYLYTLVLIRCTVYDVIVPYVVDSNNGRGVYSKVTFISLRVLEGAAFIRGRHLIE